MCVCAHVRVGARLSCGNEGAYGKKKDSEREEKKIEFVLASGTKIDKRDRGKVSG